MTSSNKIKEDSGNSLMIIKEEVDLTEIGKIIKVLIFVDVALGNSLQDFKSEGSVFNVCQSSFCKRGQKI